MLTIFRRHNQTRKNHQGCPHSEDPYYKRCRCPMWIRGTIDGLTIKESLTTRSWEKAEAERDRRNHSEDPTRPKEEPITVADAVDQFLADSGSRGCGEETLHKLRFIFKNDRLKIEQELSPSLLAYATERGIKTLRMIDLKFLRDWRNQWADEPLSKQKKQERVRSFFRFCVANKFIAENPAVGLSKIIVKKKPTLCFNREEFDALLDATHRYPDNYRRFDTAPASRLRTLMMFMRYSGLAIADAVCCAKKRLDKEGNLYLYRAKTGEPVFVPLPPFLSDELRNCPEQTEVFWFWSAPQARSGDFSTVADFSGAELPWNVNSPCEFYEMYSTWNWRKVPLGLVCRKMVTTRVLVVDDELVFLNPIVKILSRHGYDVFTANGSREALEIIKSSDRHFDVVLADVIMPEMRGTDLIREIASATPQTAFVLMTAGLFGPPLDLLEGVPLLRKPFPTSDLLAAIQGALERRRTGGEAP